MANPRSTAAIAGHVDPISDRLIRYLFRVRYRLLGDNKHAMVDCRYLADRCRRDHGRAPRVAGVIGITAALC